MSTSWSLILCEGYDDRAFLGQWLLRLGCVVAPRGAKRKVLDPFGRPVEGGRYAYLTPMGHFVVVVPCQGREKLAPMVRILLEGRYTHPIRHLLVVADPDTESGAPQDRSDPIADLLATCLQGTGAARTAEGWQLDGVLLRPISWRCDDLAGVPGVPGKQNLERLVCAALAEIHPERAPVIEAWLAAEPRGPVASGKAHLGSHVAKWAPDEGTEGLFRSIWADAGLRAALERRLRMGGGWAAMEALLQEPADS